MGWVRSLCLSALPSTWRGNQDGYRCSSSALPISGWRFCDALSDRCFAGGSLILCVSLPGPKAVLAWSRFCRFPDGSRLYSLPGLETLLCRAHCTCTADEICTCTADRSAPARPLISSHPLYFGVFLLKILFALAIGSRAFCTVTTSHSDNYCSYYVLNITSFLFPSDGIYLGGWIKIFGLYIKKFPQLSTSKLVS